MDWARIFTRGLTAFVGTAATTLVTSVAGGDPPTSLTWISVIATGAVASTTTIEALIARSAKPCNRPEEPL